MDTERCQDGNRPSLLLAYTDAAYASQCGRYFRRLGWEVQMVASAADVEELAFEASPDVLAIDLALLDRAGLNIPLCKSHPRIVLIANRGTNDIDGCLRAIRADQVVYREDGAQALVETILGSAVLSEAV